MSVGLSMVTGVEYLHENSEIGALLMRKGTQLLSEDEILQVVDLSLASEAPGRTVAEAHMLTGLKLVTVHKLSSLGLDVTTHGVLVEAHLAVF